MEIRGVGAGGLDPRLAGVPRAVTPNVTPQIGADAVAGLLREVSESQIASLLSMVGATPSSERVAQADLLFQAAVVAMRGGEVNNALTKLATMLPLDPRRAERLASDPLLVSIRKDVEAMLSRLTGAATLDAETRLREATEFLQGQGSVDPEIEEVRASTLVAVAGRLVEAGGYANCVQSSEISRMILDPARWAPVESPVPLTKPVLARGVRRALLIRWQTAAARMKNLWRRAPLLVLLVGWLLIGVVVGAAQIGEELFFEIWVLGFLGLVGFGFYMRVRNR